jgi:(S)-3,5-dihydroxyphenylglycine transaminase
MLTDGRSTVALRGCFEDPLLNAMNFLNEVVREYPEAISFAPGRPPEQWFDIRAQIDGIASFVDASRAADGVSLDRAWARFGQYDRTNGIINDLLARHLRRDEGIFVSPASVMVTVGAQEAMAVVLAGLFVPGRDLLLVADPTYIGITALARILGISVVPVPSGPAGLDPDVLERTIVDASARGRVRALYLIPDFNNPLGVTMTREARERVLQLADLHDLLVIEDNAYGMYAYDEARLPTLKALDRACRVVYVGSFSKTLFPSLRVGYLVADQDVDGSARTLAQELSKVKSLLTVNTPALCQALTGAVLMRTGGSLEPVVCASREQCRRNRDVMLAALGEAFSWAAGRITWNRPAGGFFLTLTLPFTFTAADVATCARDHGVIVCPMQIFSLQGDRACEVRLSFSAVTEQEIVTGVERLAAFCRRACAGERFSCPPSASSSSRPISTRGAY